MIQTFEFLIIRDPYHIPTRKGCIHRNKSCIEKDLNKTPDMNMSECFESAVSFRL